MQAAVQVIQDPVHASTVLEPERLRLLEMLAEPDSASGVARKLGLQRQKVNYHLQQLERDGFVELVEERRKGNCMERVMRATARSYVISPSALGRLGLTPEEAGDRYSTAYLIGAAARVIREAALLRSRADRAQKKLASFTLETEVRFASAVERTAFAEELTNAVARLAAKYHTESSPSGRTFRFVVSGYPAVTKTETDDHTAVRMD
jgi:DNA-binding transcriptional ArsR family regulator